MEIAAENLNFELAAKLRDRINAIKKATESQKIIDTNQKNTDVIAISQNSEYIAASVLMYRFESFLTRLITSLEKMMKAAKYMRILSHNTIQTKVIYHAISL